MPLLCWSEQFSVKIPSFDQQHQKLFQLVNQLHEARLAGTGADLVGNVLAELMKYTAEHMASEEGAMRITGYPELQQHRAEHLEFTSMVCRFSREFVAGRATLTDSILEYMENWLRTHILGTDQKYGIFLASRGVI